jgi:hypothetical protein
MVSVELNQLQDLQKSILGARSAEDKRPGTDGVKTLKHIFDACRTMDKIMENVDS